MSLPNSATGKLIYIYTRDHGPLTTDDLHEELDIQRIELHPVLRQLAEKGFVDRSSQGYVAV